MEKKKHVNHRMWNDHYSGNEEALALANYRNMLIAAI